MTSSIFSCALLSVCVYLEKCLNPLPIFKLGSLSFCGQGVKCPYIFWMQVCHPIFDLRIVSSILWPLHFLGMSFDASMFLMKSYLLFILLSGFLMSNLRNHCYIQAMQMCAPKFSSKSFILLSIKFRSVVHFELIFMYSMSFHVFCCMSAFVVSESYAKDWLFSPLNAHDILALNQFPMALWGFLDI